MNSSELTTKTLSLLSFNPTEEQYSLVVALSAYMTERLPRDVFILNGYAGTGKTSIIAAFVKSLKCHGVKTIILAPTGRAAKVASSFARQKAFTIHKRIFRGDSLNPANEAFFLAPNKEKNTVFIVDEASLISDSEEARSSLLTQLIYHVYSGEGCSMILVGDLAQLPPVNQSKSLAMNPDRLREIGLNPLLFHLKKPVRQAAKSGILYNATVIRKFLFENADPINFFINKRNFRDVEIVSSRDLPDLLSDSWTKVGREETLIITRSNKRANSYNAAVRQNILFSEEPIERGERLIVCKNNYYWGPINKTDELIANGETAEVLWVGKKEKVYGRWFQELEIKLSDQESPMNVWIMLRSLVAEGTSIDRVEMERFYNRVLSEHEGELSHKIKSALEDPYYNALQVKYAYCVTCHKAQGGQWKHVYIDMAAISPDAMGEDFFRWLYTAVTRATEKIFFINPTVSVK